MQKIAKKWPKSGLLASFLELTTYTQTNVNGKKSIGSYYEKISHVKLLQTCLDMLEKPPNTFNF